MSKTRAKATKERSLPPRFPDGKFFHDVPLFDLDFLKPRKQQVERAAMDREPKKHQTS